MSSREEILASIRKHTQSHYEKPDIADMKRLTYPRQSGAVLRYQPCCRWYGSGIGQRGRCECCHSPDVSGCDAHCFRTAGYILCNFQSGYGGRPERTGRNGSCRRSGEIGVAENGAIWIPQQVKYKAIYFISESLVILIDRNKIVDTMYDAYCQLDGQEYQFGTFISGPSKTADIEQALVMGAHGAREVLVILT